MNRTAILMRGAAISALLALSATAAMAGPKTNRAREAIAEASAKIDAANKVGASGDVPRLQAQAQATLRNAREDLARGHKEQAIDEAHHASQLADTAIGMAERDRAAASRAQRDNAEAAASAARSEAAEANARANSAEHAAADAAAAAQAARDAPPPMPVVIAAPPPAPAPATTVTVQSVEHRTNVPVRTASAAPRRRVVHRRATRVAHAHSVTERTTTTVTTAPNPGQ